MSRYILPLGIFVVLAAFLGAGLKLNPREIPSPLIDKLAPEFTLPQLHQPAESFSKSDMAGQVWLLNVWASWCVACRQEHPLLVQLARTNEVPIIGLDYKDDPVAGINWLKRHGDPYQLSISDAKGRVGIDFGVYGVPETFLIDQEGRIRYKQIGPLTPKAIAEILLPKVRELKAAGA